MIKALFCTLLVSCTCCNASAQVVIALLFGDKLNTDKLEFGLVVTPALTNITNNNSNWKSGLNLGIYFNIRPDKRLFLHIEGVAKGSLGARSITPYATGNDSLDDMFTYGSVLRKIRAFSLPVLARYEITKKIFAEAGTQINMRLAVKDFFRATTNGNDLQYTIKTSDDYTLLDIGITAGVFYKFRKDKKSMGIGLRYFQGLTDIYKVAGGTQANCMLQADITIPIGTGKSSDQHTK